MAFDPQELVFLTNHGPMRLRSAVARAMTLPFNERKRATIVRDGKPPILRYERIKDLAAEWAAKRPGGSETLPGDLSARTKLGVRRGTSRP
jgi:hypothetical protein